MVRKLKVYQTSVGFFDLAVAAPSMKAAAEAWGSDPDIFRQGFARETDEPQVVEATMAAPGVVLRRPVGSRDRFTRDAPLPRLTTGRKASGSAEAGERQDPGNRGGKGEPAKKAREEQARKEAEAARKQRERSQAKAEAAFERARRRHENATRSIESRRAELAREELLEDERWQREQQAHEDALRGIEP